MADRAPLIPIQDTAGDAVGEARIATVAARAMAQDPELWTLTPVVSIPAGTGSNRLVGLTLTPIPVVEAHRG